MEIVQAIFDGNKFRLLDPIPVKGKYNVQITFLSPYIDDIEAKIQRLMKHCGTWTKEEGEYIIELMNESRKPSLNRSVVDIS
jgi:hypothetical protein